MARVLETGEQTYIFKTEVQSRTLNPVWKEIQVKGVCCVFAVLVLHLAEGCFGVLFTWQRRGLKSLWFGWRGMPVERGGADVSDSAFYLAEEGIEKLWFDLGWNAGGQTSRFSACGTGSSPPEYCMCGTEQPRSSLGQAPVLCPTRSTTQSRLQEV